MSSGLLPIAATTTMSFAMAWSTAARTSGCSASQPIETFMTRRAPCVAAHSIPSGIRSPSNSPPLAEHANWLDLGHAARCPSVRPCAAISPAIPVHAPLNRSNREGRRRPARLDECQINAGHEHAASQVWMRGVNTTVDNRHDDAFALAYSVGLATSRKSRCHWASRTGSARQRDGAPTTLSRQGPVLSAADDALVLICRSRRHLDPGHGADGSGSGSITAGRPCGTAHSSFGSFCRRRTRATTRVHRPGSDL